MAKTDLVIEIEELITRIDKITREKDFFNLKDEILEKLEQATLDISEKEETINAQNSVIKNGDFAELNKELLETKIKYNEAMAFLHDDREGDQNLLDKITALEKDIREATNQADIRQRKLEQLSTILKSKIADKGVLTKKLDKTIGSYISRLGWKTKRLNIAIMALKDMNKTCHAERHKTVAKLREYVIRKTAEGMQQCDGCKKPEIECEC